VKSNDVYKAAFHVFREKSLEKYLPDDIGYGVGLRQSEFFPIIEKGSDTVLEKNMVIALLQTTSFMRKIGGLRVEDVFLIKQTGFEKLTQHEQSLF
jgi:Xaa-Pro aminopeptidase